MSAAPELWQRALDGRAKTLQAEHNRSARSRLALARLLERCGHPVSLVTIHTWSRRTQGHAYQWAIGYLNGVENAPPPWLVLEELAPR